MKTIIDSHIHFWDLKNNINQWVYNEKKELQQDFLPTALPCKQFVHIEAHDSAINTIQEIKWLETQLSQYHMRYIGYGDFYVDDHHFLLQLNQLKKYSKVVGIRQIMSYHTESTYSPCQYHYLPKNFTQKLTLLKDHHYIFECQMYASQLLNILGNISDSQVTTVIEHMALPLTQSSQEMQAWHDLIKEITQYTNIILKLSGFYMMNSQEKPLDGCLDAILSNIPSQRLCYGSNFPVDNHHHYTLWQETLMNKLPQITHEDIFYNTANKVYFRP
ncbi:amidohydrolase family protein [Piscirickettsia salmonis]|uniref:amidohydrolase family protein n=1 Tax=Piscirickettsia salmonis TaxID=1238 RepID=UPI003EBDDD3F